MLVQDFRKVQVIRGGYLQKRRWTRLEVVIAAIAVSFMIVAGVLLVTRGTGSWFTLIGCALGVVLGLLRYRAERTAPNLDAGEHNK